MTMKQLWTEKYRPATAAEYVFRDEAQREQVQSWISQGMIPHLLFSGVPGTGKTTLAKILINELGIDGYDVLEINASRDNGVEFIKNKIEGFVQTMPFGDFKVVLLDEADYLTHNAQAILRGLMETYAASARFILTCNHRHKIIPALQSRCQGFHISTTDQVEFTARVAKVLIDEGVTFDIDVLDTYVKASYPDLRKCLNMCQSHSVTGVLEAPNVSDYGGDADWRLTVTDLFKQRKITEARKALCANARSEEMEDIFRWMYDNLDLWSTDPEKQDQAIIIIRNGYVNVPLVADQEINLSATFVELAQL